MGPTPGILESGRGQVAAVVAGNGGPEVETVSVVNAVQSGHVDVLPFIVGLDVVGDESKLSSLLGSALRGQNWLWQDWLVILALCGGLARSILSFGAGRR